MALWFGNAENCLPRICQICHSVREFVLVSGVIDTVVALRSLYKEFGIIIIIIFSYSVR